MKTILKVCSIFVFFNCSLAAAIEITGSQGEYQSRVIQGKIYDVRGKYTGMITPDGNMYDKQGNFTGKIRNRAILNSDGSTRGFIRDGKIFNDEGVYQGQLKP